LLCFGFGIGGISAVAMDGETRNDIGEGNWEARYRKQERYYARFIKKYDTVMEERAFFKQQAYNLEAELGTLRPQGYRQQQRINRLEERVERLEAENDQLRKRLAAIAAPLDTQTRSVPAFVKANVPKKPKKRPGRKPGHEPAHRPMPEKIDSHIEVPIPHDATGAASCPHCNTQLNDVKQHERIVEDIIPSKAVVKCYHTTSGYCPCCRKRMESRAPEQPPAADVPHGQVGLNALAMAGLLRIEYRLPYELISQLMADLPGITISKGALAKQIARLGKWLEGEYEQIRRFLQLAPAVNMDETSWRVDGKNRWLWALLDKLHTLYHVDKSRGSKVVAKLLGEVFGGTLITDFYSAYGRIDCQKQKCLVHLLRELRDTAAKSPAFARSSFHRRLKRLVKELLLLRKSKAEMKLDAYQIRGRRLEERLKELAAGKWEEAHAKRLAKRLRKHEKELTLFLWEDVDATNNAAERALRPAVVMRKITGGSRSERGAKATSVLMSVMRTARQQDRPIYQTIQQLVINAWANKDPGLLTNLPDSS
jgi:transposase